MEGDPELRASLDRIDSDGHYGDGSFGDGPHNLQLVTHWYYLAKGTRSDDEMRRLIALHAGSIRMFDAKSPGLESAAVRKPVVRVDPAGQEIDLAPVNFRLQES